MRINQTEVTMAKFDLSGMSLDELKSLKKDVESAIAGYEDRRRKEALAAAKEAASQAGFSLDELVGRKRTRKSPKAAAPKYAHPENPELTWSGRGRRPAWIAEGLAQGKSLEDYLIR